MSRDEDGLCDDSILSGLFADGVRAVASSIGADGLDVRPAERELVRGAVEKRQLEFLTGRSLARRALGALGHPDFVLLRESDRTPLWPAGVVGSISHTRAAGVPGAGGGASGTQTASRHSLCAVVVARTAERSGLGIDVEPDAPVKPGLEREICLPSERAWLEGEGPEVAGRRCRLVFSAKEAVYKAFYPRVREVWGFREVEVQIDLAAGTFEASLPAAAGRATVQGRIARRSGWILSGVEYV